MNRFNEQRLANANYNRPTSRHGGLRRPLYEEEKYKGEAFTLLGPLGSALS